MKTKLLVLGDSYCSDSAGWPSYLANLLDAELFCYGMGGQPWWDVKIWMDKNQQTVDDADIIVFAHTNAERIPSKNKDIGKIDHNKKPESEIEHAIQLYYKYIHCHDFLNYAQQLWFRDISTKFANKTLVHLHCFDGSEIQHSSELKGINIFPNLTSISVREPGYKANTMHCDFRQNHFSDTNNRVLAEEIYTAIDVGSCTYTLNIEKFELKK